MDITEIRRNNLQAYRLEKFKTQRAFADHIGKSAAQVNKWFLNTKNRQSIGEKLARDLEKKLNLPFRWLDKEHDLAESELVQALKSLNYEVKENDEVLECNGSTYKPQYRVNTGIDAFYVSTMTDSVLSSELISIANGLNLYNSMGGDPKNAIILLCEDDLFFAKQGRLQDVIEYRLDDARFVSPYQISDFLVTKEYPSSTKPSKDLWKLLNEHYSSIGNNKSNSDAIIAVRSILESNGLQVIDVPQSKSGPLMVINEVIWANPSLIVALPEQAKSFYIDISPEEHLNSISLLTENKYPEVLFIKQSKIYKTDSLVRNHIEKWFT